MYNRIVLKLSGETLAPIEFTPTNKSYSFDADRVALVAEKLAEINKKGVQLGIVMGGGNIWRGRFTDTMDPVNADNMGMLATIINAICVHDALAQNGVASLVFTAQEMPKFGEVYRAEKAIEAMESGKIVLLAGGTGNPFFTTDTGSALRAAELKADALFKGTNVDGVYDKDPNKYPDAKLIKDITYKECIDKGLGVMDATAFEICRKQKISGIRIFNMEDLSNIVKVIDGDSMGTVIHA